MNRYVSVQSRGTIALPPDVRQRYGLDEPGAQVELVEREDGVLELHPHLPMPVMTLSNEQSLFVASLLSDPPPPNERLRTAMREHRERGRAPS